MDERTILLVEDNPDDVLLTKLAFERQSVCDRIDVAVDGVEALDYLFAKGAYAGRAPTLPDLILLDLKLPRLGGLDVLKSVREDERTKYLPIVVLTSSSEESDIVGSYDHGANSFLQKPVDFEEFVSAARAIGLYWLTMNRPGSAK